MSTTRPRGTCPRCSRDVALLRKATTPAQHKCLDGLPWPRSEGPLDDRPRPARLEFTGAEHAMFAEILLTGAHDDRYGSRADQVAAAAVHAQLALVSLHAADAVERTWDQDALRYEWAHCLAIRGPADTADVELAELTTGNR